MPVKKMAEIRNLDDMRSIYDRMATSGRRITQGLGRSGVVQSARDRQDAALDQLRNLETDRISRRARLNMMSAALDALAGMAQALGPPVQATQGPTVPLPVGPATPFEYRAAVDGDAECFCLEPVEEGQMVVRCRNPVRAHIMHAACFEPWRRQKAGSITRLVPCPMCRIPMQRKTAPSKAGYGSPMG